MADCAMSSIAVVWWVIVVDTSAIVAVLLDEQFEAVLTGTRVTKMEETDSGMRVVLEGKRGGDEIFDKVTIAVGRKPFTGDVGLETTRVSLSEKGAVEVDARGRFFVGKEKG